MRKIVIRFSSIVLIALIIIVSTLYLLQEQLIFPAPTVAISSTNHGIFKTTMIPTSDGETLFSLYHSPIGSKPTILVFHGNGDAAIFQIRKGETLAAAGFGVLLMEYRGYPGSTGTPSERGLSIDARAAYDFAKSKANNPIGIYAHSLGTGVAVHLASERPVFAMVLESPFDSLMAVAQKRMPWLPMRWLLKHKFRSDQLIGNIKVPVLILHGSKDRVIPVEHGRKLASLTNANAKFIEIEGAGHNDLASFGTLAMASDFLSEALAGENMSDTK